MSRRPLPLLALSLLTLSLAACSDITAPTTSNQNRPMVQPTVARSAGGTLSSEGRR